MFVVNNSTGGLNVVESQEKLAQKEEGNSRKKIGIYHVIKRPRPRMRK